MRAQPVPWSTSVEPPAPQGYDLGTSPRNSCGTSIEARSSGSESTLVDARGEHLGLGSVS